MNVETPAHGLSAVLKSLNGDRGHGIALLACLVVLLLPEAAGPVSREALGYQREALAAGQWWRLLTGNFVHLDLEHAVLNGFGLVLMWALFARDYPPWRWLAIYLGSALAVTAGLWFLSPQIEWYVGASGALHGVMTAGTLAHLRRGDLDGWILTGFIAVKLGFEQIVGALPFAGSPDTVVDAHLYGALGGVVLAIILSPGRRPA
jgi:rhomboid family GlyGly-CTERM serine protease